MPAETAIFRQCLDEAIGASAKLIERSLDLALNTLQEAENKSGKTAERHELADASRELHKQRADWISRFPRELRLAIEVPPAPATPSATPGAGKLESLTLVDDAQVDKTIESLRLSEMLQSMVEQPLAELDGLMSSALGLAAVRPEQNPLRPEIFAHVLRKVMTSAVHQPAWPALWARHLAPAMGRELEQLYRKLIQLLTQANVRAASYSVLSVPSAPAAVAAAAQRNQHGQMHGQAQPQRQDAAGSFHTGDMPPRNDPRTRGGSAWADLSAFTLRDELIQDFLFRGGSQAEAPLAPAYYARVSTELNDLLAQPPDEPAFVDAQEQQQYRGMPAVDRPLRQISTDTALRNEVWGELGGARQRSLVRTQLKKQAQRVGQVLGLEVVRKLVNQVAQDPRLLAPVRESIVALEPSLLRLAMVDPRFFSDDRHPGRRLVERVAERSFKFNDEFSSEFQDFSASVEHAFSELNGREVEDLEPFQSALASLEATWTEQDAQEERQREEVMEAVRFAEQRQAQADQIAWDLSQRSDLEDVPSVVQDFLYGPWALVMAHARMTDGQQQIDPGAHGSVVTDLLWSVKRDITLRQPARLIEMIPSLLERLRVGLAALGQTPQENDAFFETLEKLHRPVLRLRAKRRRDAGESAPMELEPEADIPQPAPRQQPKTGNTPWMGQKELDVAGFQDTLPTDYAELAQQAEQSGAAAGSDADDLANAVQLAAAQVEQMIAGLREGCWVDLCSKGKWLRARLIWASSKGTLFMFASHGGQPHSMTRRSCERLLRDRLLRPVEMHGVVSHAIGALADKPQREAVAA
jgi:hypothetical protein